MAEHILHLEKVPKDNVKAEEQCQQPSSFSLDCILEQFWVNSKIKQKVQRVPVYPLPSHKYRLPTVNNSHHPTVHEPKLTPSFSLHVHSP